MSDELSAITLRALEGRPLADGAVRRIVVATARAIAERHGVELVGVEPADDRVTLTLRTHRLAAIGFASELRRLTTAWYAGGHPGRQLWGEARVDPDEDDPADWWKGA